MIFSALILILSTAMFFFYFQVTCQRVLRLQFDKDYFLSIVNANGLEFMALRKSLEGSGVPVNYPRLREMLKRDYHALTYLLKNATNVGHHRSKDEWLLIIYFRWQMVSLAVRHLLRVSDSKPIIALTSILQYFANVVGQRVTIARFANMTAAAYVLKD